MKARAFRVAPGRRMAGKAVAVSPPRWPLALDLGRAGTPLAVVLLAGRGDRVQVCSIDADADLVVIGEADNLVDACRWCRLRNLRVCTGFGDLVEGLKSGAFVGWLPGAFVEDDGRRQWVVEAVPFVGYPRLAVSNRWRSLDD